MVKGRAEIVGDETLRVKAIELILRKYSPEHMETGMKYAAGSLPRTAIVRVAVNRISGKCKKAGFD